jgi:SNF2 family DNA or RNA helicase
MGLMSRAFTPHEYQKIALDFMLDTPRCALFAGMGLGKTVSSLTLIDMLYLTGNDAPVLVLGPKRVAANTWPEEAAKWDHLKHLEVSPIVGDPRQRRAALHRPAHIYTTNYEQLPWLVDAYDKRPWPFRTVIADESPRLKGHREKGQGGFRTNHIAKVARETDRWVNLTGTPAANGLKDLWGQFWFLDFGQRLGATYTAFKERWFRADYSGYGVKPLPNADREIHATISDITLSIRPEDWFDLEKPIERTVPVRLSKALMTQYQRLESEMFTKLTCGTELEVFNAAALTNKCRQFANGAAYTEHPNWVPVHDAKLEALESIVQEAAGASLLVSYEFVSDRERILKHFKNAVDISKPAGLKAFKAGKAQLGIAHPQSMGHGIDGLQDICNMVVYFGTGWNLEYHQQILERVGPVRQMQSGHKRAVWVWSIVVQDTIDEVLIERHAGKREVQDLLLEAMSRRNR